MATTGTLARGQALKARFGSGKTSLALTTLYIALFIGDPLGTGVEATGGGYGRAAVDNVDALWGTIALDAVSITNISSINFPVSTGSYAPIGPYDMWAIMSTPGPGGGVVWYTGAIANALSVLAATDQPRFPAGSLTIYQDA